MTTRAITPRMSGSDELDELVGAGLGVAEAAGLPPGAALPLPADASADGSADG